MTPATTAAMTPERRRELLSATALGHWVAGFGWNPDQPRGEHGRWSRGQPYSPTADYGEGADRPHLVQYPEHLPQAFLDKAKAWDAELSSGQRWAVQDYTVNLYKPVNRALRDAGGDPAKVTDDSRVPGSHSASVREAVELLTAAARKMPPHEQPVTCWRLLSLTHEKMDAFTKAAEAAAASGAEFKMPVFGSATLNPEMAWEMSWGAGLATGGGQKDPIHGVATSKRSVLLEIRSRTGMPVGAAELSGVPMENELLQPPTAVYRVLGWKNLNFGSQTRRALQLEEVLPDPPGPPAPK